MKIIKFPFDMKIIEFHLRFMKKFENLGVPIENHENQENLRIT